jgi:cellobiose epimerase
MEKLTVDPGALSRRIEAHLFGHILPFWCGPALDHEKGGWMAWLSNDLKPDRSQPKGLVVNSRILWAFSAAFRAEADAGLIQHAVAPQVLRQMAENACKIVLQHFWDNAHGGAFWRLDDNFHPVDHAKKTYGQAFYIYALAEYYQAFGESAARDRAIELFELIERHARDKQQGGYWEVRRRDWSEASETRLSDKDLNEKKSMNNHLHVLEAYTNLWRIWKDERLQERLQELIRIFENRILDHEKQHLHHFFDEQWQVRSDTYTFGHDIEGSWLLCEAAEALQDEVLLKRVEAVALGMATAVLDEALDQDGGLFYEGRAGKILDRGKECWPQAEAVVGFLNAYQISRDPKYSAAAARVWDFIELKLADRVHGEWFWRIGENGQPDPKLPKVSEWKGPYHGTRACLEARKRLHRIICESYDSQATIRKGF